jgi:hypothetical protein
MVYHKKISLVSQTLMEIWPKLIDRSTHASSSQNNTSSLQYMSCDPSPPTLCDLTQTLQTPATRPTCVRHIPIRFAPLRCASHGLTLHCTYPAVVPLPRVPLGTFHTPLRHVRRTCATV